MITTPIEDTPSFPAGHALEYISASRVQCWQSCRRKFYFRYVAKLPGKPSPALHIGKSVHAALQEWNMLRWKGKPIDRDALQSSLMKAWLNAVEEVEWESKEAEKKAFDQAWGMVTTYLDQTPIEPGEPILGVEVRVEASLPGLPPIIGIIDLIRKTDGGGKVVDFKTAAKTPSETICAHSHSTQLGIYSLLYRESTGEYEGGLELHHLIKTKVPKVVVTEIDPLSDRQHQNLRDLLHRFVQSVEAEDYTPSPSFMCNGCEYLTECLAFQQESKGGQNV